MLNKYTFVSCAGSRRPANNSLVKAILRGHVDRPFVLDVYTMNGVVLEAIQRAVFGNREDVAGMLKEPKVTV